MKNAKLVAEYETNVCSVKVYYDVDPQTYYMSLTSGTRNEIRLFGPFKREHLENLVEALKDVKEMKGKHYFIEGPTLVNNLGDGWSVSPTLIEIIKDLVPVNSTILELGSGEGTDVLSEHFKVYSVEHDSEWVGKYKSTYIHAPLKEHKPVGGIGGDEPVEWYDPDVLRAQLPKHYDLLLIDGPPKNRSGFIKYFELFKADVPMIFDDVHRARDLTVMTKIAARLSRPYTVYGLHETKHFGVILP